MANLYDALQSVNFDIQAAQFLLESQCLSTDYSSNADGTEEDKNTSPVDEDDVFQCGKCKKNFTSFQLFVLHKREHKQGDTSKLQSCDILLPLDGSASSTSEAAYCQLRVDSLGTESPDIQAPVIFSESDVLSFAVDRASLDLSTPAELSENSTGARLPSIHCLRKGTKMLTIEEPADVGDNSGRCQILVSGTDCGAASSHGGTGKVMHCEEVAGLLNYSSEQTVMSSSNMLQNVEISAIRDAGVEYIGCEVSLENTSGHQNVVIDYNGGSIQPDGRDNVDISEGTRNSQLQNVTVTRKAQISSSPILRLVTENCGTEVTNQEVNLKMQAPQVSKSMLKCSFCTKSFTKNFDLQQHIRSHTGEKPFQCVVCGRAFAQKSNAKKHMQAHKVWPKDQTTLPKKANKLDVKETNAGSTKNLKASGAAQEKTVDYPTLRRSYTCQFCDMTFSLYIELKSHMKNHSDQKVYKCIQKDCIETFSELESFLTHTNTAHVSGLQYRCHVCNKKFVNLESLGLHQYSHGMHAKSGNKSLTRGLVCYKCKRKFKTHAALEHHLDTSSHHFPCPCCGKVFTWESYLRRHLTIHGPEESYPCPECGKCFRTEPYLRAHVLIHSETRPFVCQHCGATFNRRDKLSRHSLIHQAVKKYRCPFRSYLGCSREFSRQDKLKLHLLTHSAAKPIRCKNCTKTFSRLSQLKEHEKLQCHKERKHKCVDCGIDFKSKLLLSSHSCSRICRQDSSKSSAISTTNSGNQYSEGEIEKQKLSLPKTKGMRNASKIGSSDDVSITSKSDKDICRDSVSTIEIIVVPVPANSADAVECGSGEKNVCIIYQSGETSSVPTESLNNSDNLRNPEYVNIILPRRKDCAESIPAMTITKNSKNSIDN